tara:strand:+ start:2289 stop:2717 length:429 start_codon:yes stop_codon:yes gene_type:complete
MNTITITGGKHSERCLVRETAIFCLKKLLPKSRNLELMVRLKTMKDWGECRKEDFMNQKGKVFTIHLKRNLGIYDMMSTLCHEMVHVKQFALGERKFVKGNDMWKKRAYNNTSYEDSPWEKEAYRLEERLAVECFKTIKTQL